MPKKISGPIVTEDDYVISATQVAISRKLSNGTSDEIADTQNVKKPEGFFNFKTEVVWRNVVIFTIAHIIAVYCALTFDYLRDGKTFLWFIATVYLSGSGTVVGVHRYWTHRTFKAKWPIRLFLALSFYLAGQNKIYDWVRDHRVHHKYTETDADPHNSNRGFFFSHIGWLMMRKHPEVIKRGQEIDMSDILADPIVTFCDKHFHLIRTLMIFIIPTLVPVYFWNETWTRAFISQGVIRYVVTLNFVWSVNSFAHLWGTRPFDANIKPADNIWVSMVAGGEGWHNYHHVFPWDYKGAETPYFLNLGTMQIHFWYLLGLAYDLKEPSLELVKETAMKRGDGTRAHLWDEVPLPKSKAM